MDPKETRSQVVQLLQGRTARLEWGDLSEIVDRFVATKTIDWWLPVSACQSLDRSPELAIPASAAVLASQAAIIIVDDILDEDPKGIHREIGVGKAANLALALESLAFECLMESPASARAKHSAIRSLSDMFSITSFGQAQDVGQISSEVEYWSMIRNKSTPFYGTALQLGALLAEGTDEVAESFHELGVIVGEIVQLHDDLFDAFETPAKPDWRRQSNNLLILYALTVEHEEREEFLDILSDVSAAKSLKRLQEILLSSGAVSYCIYHLNGRHERCRQLIDRMELPNTQPMQDLVESQVGPMRSILNEAGVAFPVG